MERKHLKAKKSKNIWKKSGTCFKLLKWWVSTQVVGCIYVEVYLPAIVPTGSLTMSSITSWSLFALNSQSIRRLEGDAGEEGTHSLLAPPLSSLPTCHSTDGDGGGRASYIQKQGILRRWPSFPCNSTQIDYLIIIQCDFLNFCFRCCFRKQF